MSDKSVTTKVTMQGTYTSPVSLDESVPVHKIKPISATEQSRRKANQSRDAHTLLGARIWSEPVTE